MIDVGHVQSGTGGRRPAPRRSSPPSRPTRSRCSPPKCSAPAAIAESDISSATRRRSSGSRTRRTCPTFSSRSTSAVTDADRRSTAVPSPPAVSASPRRAASMIATSARTSVRFSPCSSANRCPTASSSTVSRRRRSASSWRASTSPPSCLRPSDRPLISRRSRLSTIKGNHASPLASPAGCCRPLVAARLARQRRRRSARSAAKLTGLQENDIAAFLPDSAESTRVQELQAEFQPTESIPAVSCCGRTRTALDEATLAEIGERLAGRDRGRRGRRRARRRGLAADPVRGRRGGPGVPPARRPTSATTCSRVVDDLRALDRASTGRTPSSPARPASSPTSPSGFEGIDGLLLLAAFGVVLLILLVVYRSPLLPLLVIATAGLALTAANAVAYLLADGGCDHRQRPEPGHRLDPGRRRGHRLRPAAGRPVPRGAAPGAVEVHRHADRAAPVVGADRRLRRHRHPRRPLPALLRPRLQPRPRPDLRGERHPRRRRRAHLPAGGAGAARAAPRSGRSARSTASSPARPRLGRGSPRSSAAVRAGCSR